jgi:hypothetical protein
MSSTRLLLLLLLFAGVGCSSTDPELSQCVGPITVTVSPTPPRTFSWTPNCLVTHVIVYLMVPNVTAVWRVQAENPTGRSPVVYGQTPLGFQTITPPSPLVSGGQYRVEILASPPFGQIGNGSADFVVP